MTSSSLSSIVGLRFGPGEVTFHSGIEAVIGMNVDLFRLGYAF